MKKVLFVLIAMVCSLTASAHIFDGIDLNGNVSSIAKAISLKGYVTDPATGKLKGNCQGTEIYLSMNYKDTTEKNKLGQLIIDIPVKGDISAIATIFNVIYHQTSHNGNTYTYVADEDGTTMTLQTVDGGVQLIYNTPYYKK